MPWPRPGLTRSPRPTGTSRSTSSRSEGTSPATTAGGTTSTRDLVLFAVGDGAPNVFGTPAPGTWSDTTAIASATIYQSVWYQTVGPGTTVDPAGSETVHQWDAALVGLQLAP